jgi:hypothetical protein
MPINQGNHSWMIKLEASAAKENLKFIWWAIGGMWMVKY